MSNIALSPARGIQVHAAITLFQLASDVAREPAVQEAWRAAATDCSTAFASMSESRRLTMEAMRSVAGARRQTQVAWRAGKAQAALA